MNILLKSYSTLKSKKRKGFTLIELVVVIATMAVLAMILVPNLTAYNSKANTAKVRANMRNIYTASELVNQTEGDLILDDIIAFSNAKSGTVEISSNFVDKTYTVSRNSETGKIEIKYTDEAIGDQIFPDNGGSLVSGPIDESGNDEPGNDEPGIDESRIDSLIAEGYIPVATAEDLNSVRSTNSRLYAAGTKWEKEAEGGLGKKYVQVANINLSEREEGWIPIGTDLASSFKGTYDGGSYVITGLEIKGADNDFQGLFGYTQGATIRNVGLIDNKVTGRGHIGGLVGIAWNTTIINSYATGTVKGLGNNIGGLVGYATGSSKISNSYATGTVTGNRYVGGLVGNADNKAMISNSHAEGSVNGAGWFVGGLVGGALESAIEKSYATGSVTGSLYVGGLAGYANKSNISNSYATGSVKDSGNAGGLVGRAENGSTIINSYSTGSVTGSTVGGLVGSVSKSTVTNSYWDTVTTGQYTSAEQDESFGKTTDEMKKQTTYEGWDTNVWNIVNGDYPKLK